MHSLPQSVQKVIDDFVRLPGIGPKTASRLVLFLLHAPDSYTLGFADSLENLKKKVKFCKTCYNLAEQELCPICEDSERQKNRIIVVEDILDLLAFENIGEYRGQYHVLGGLISPMQGIGPEDITIGRLVNRVKEFDGDDLEVIVATNPNLEGEATAMYIKNELEHIRPNVNISRIARGLPSGADLDYADRVTLLKSYEGRVTL